MRIFAAVFVLFAVSTSIANAQSNSLLASAIDDYKAEQYSAAIKKLNKIVAELPGNSSARWYRGIAAAKTGAFEKARGDFAAYVRLRPNDPGSHNSYAWLLATVRDRRQGAR